MNERLEATISGRVQMVMYRDFAARTARGLGLVGEVKNLPDGTVRAIAEGSRDSLEKFVARLRQGSLFSRVDSVVLVYSGATGTYQDFSITYE